jgi:diguanylate cyclase (GGDEF)-like protein
MQPILSMLAVAGAFVATLGASLFVLAWRPRRAAPPHPAVAAPPRERSGDSDPLVMPPCAGPFASRAALALQRATSEGAPVTAIVFDLDHFSALNETFGADAGERTLRLFADTAQGLLRPNDVISRVGGKQFAAILPDMRIEAAESLAERIRHAFAGAVSALDGLALSATVSAGVASGPAGAVALEALLKRADAALRLAKENGRDRVERAAEPPAEPCLVAVG